LPITNKADTIGLYILFVISNDKEKSFACAWFAVDLPFAKDFSFGRNDIWAFALLVQYQSLNPIRANR